MGRQQRNQEVDDKLARDKEQLAKASTEFLKAQQGETLSVLDMLRKTRKSRGGVGAPLVVPPHLRDAAKGEGIVITDADLTVPETQEEAKDELDRMLEDE